MASSLSSFVNNLAGEIHKFKCKYEHIDKKCETCGIKYKVAIGSLNIQTLNMI